VALSRSILARGDKQLEAELERMKGLWITAGDVDVFN
jgi:hypothetical protein